MLGYVLWMVILSSALAGAVDDNSVDTIGTMEDNTGNDLEAMEDSSDNTIGTIDNNPGQLQIVEQEKSSATGMYFSKNGQVFYIIANKTPEDENDYNNRIEDEDGKENEESIENADDTDTSYQKDLDYNQFVDGVITNIVDEIVKENMDPVFFTMVNKSHITKKDKSLPAKIAEGEQEKVAESLKKDYLGKGFLVGLKNIVRVGEASAEEKESSSKKQIVNKFTIGPVELQLTVQRTAASIRRQKERNEEVSFMRNIKVTIGKLNGMMLAEVDHNGFKLLRFTISPPDQKKTTVTNKRGNESVNIRLDLIGRAVAMAVFREDSFIVRWIQGVAERAVERQTVDLLAENGKWSY